MKRKNFIKKIFTAIFIFLLIFYSTNVSAESIEKVKPSVDIQVKGNIETGQNIQIFINVHDIKNLYAGSLKFKYDKSVLNVTDIQKGDFIYKKDMNIFEVGNDIDNDKGIARFKGFSCLGQVEGFSGSGTFIIIYAKILKKTDFHLKSIPLLEEPDNENNLKMQLVDNNLEDIDYSFKEYNFKVAAASSSKAAANSKTGNKDNTIKKPRNSIEDNKTIIKPFNDFSKNSNIKTILNEGENQTAHNNIDKYIEDNRDIVVKAENNNTLGNTANIENLYKESINNLDKSSSSKTVTALTNNYSLYKIKYLIITIFIIIFVILGLKIYKYILKNKN